MFIRASIVFFNNLLNIDIIIDKKEKDNRVIFSEKFNNKLDLLNIFNQSVALYILTDLSEKDFLEIDSILKDDIYIIMLGFLKKYPKPCLSSMAFIHAMKEKNSLLEIIPHFLLHLFIHTRL